MIIGLIIILLMSIALICLILAEYAGKIYTAIEYRFFPRAYQVQQIGDKFHPEVRTAKSKHWVSIGPIYGFTTYAAAIDCIKQHNAREKADDEERRANRKKKATTNRIIRVNLRKIK